MAAGRAEYTEGNRSYHFEHRRFMPDLRKFDNAVLNLLSKLSNSYSDMVDPTNGYTCIHFEEARELPLHQIFSRYFFESDMLFRFGLMDAVVNDVPMASV